MSFDLTHFRGLASSGAGVPDGTATDYIYDYGFAEDDDLVVGGNFPTDFMNCPAGADPFGAPDLEDPHYVPAGSEEASREITATLDMMTGINSRSPFDDVTFGGVGTTPDYITIHLQMGGEGSVDPPGITGFYTACLTPTQDVGSGLWHGGGADPDSFREGHADMEAIGPGTFVPDQIFTPAPVDLDGSEGHGLSGYFKRASAVYTGDPANTASEYLWTPDEIGDLTFHLFAVGIGYHKVTLLPIHFHITAFWNVSDRAPFTPVICLV